MPKDALPLELLNQESETSNTLSVLKSKFPTQNKDLKQAAQEAEYETIFRVLKEVNFNKTKAAQKLNIDRKTLYNKIKAIKIKDS